MEKNMDNINRPNTQSTIDKKSSVMDKVGGAIEKAGHKISDLGATKVGQAIHDLGDKLETDHKDPNHPHDV